MDWQCCRLKYDGWQQQRRQTTANAATAGATAVASSTEVTVTCRSSTDASSCRGGTACGCSACGSFGAGRSSGLHDSGAKQSRRPTGWSAAGDGLIGIEISARISFADSRHSFGALRWTTAATGYQEGRTSSCCCSIGYSRVRSVWPTRSRCATPGVPSAFAIWTRAQPSAANRRKLGTRWANCFKFPASYGGPR